MTGPVRISAEETRKKVLSGTAVLVCAYDDDEKFRNNRLEGAISLREFRNKVASLPKEEEIIFFCS
jgi:hypothetical protein